MTVVSPLTPHAEDATASDNLTRNTLDSHASLSAILMLSDMFKLFESHGMRGGRSAERHNHVTMKISFYAAHIMSTPSSILSSVSDEIITRSKISEGEAFSSPFKTTADRRPPAGSFSGGRA